jgi:hypothetical protein
MLKFSEQDHLIKHLQLENEKKDAQYRVIGFSLTTLKSCPKSRMTLSKIYAGCFHDRPFRVSGYIHSIHFISLDIELFKSAFAF